MPNVVRRWHFVVFIFVYIFTSSKTKWEKVTFFLSLSLVVIALLLFVDHSICERIFWIVSIESLKLVNTFAHALAHPNQSQLSTQSHVHNADKYFIAKCVWFCAVFLDARSLDRLSRTTTSTNAEKKVRRMARRIFENDDFAMTKKRWCQSKWKEIFIFFFSSFVHFTSASSLAPSFLSS